MKPIAKNGILIIIVAVLAFAPLLQVIHLSALLLLVTLVVRTAMEVNKNDHAFRRNGGSA